MKTEDKQLLLQDLCSRLSYGVIVKIRIIDFNTEESAHDHFPNNVEHLSYVGNGRLFLIDTLSNSVRIRPILKGLTYREKVFFEEICNNGYAPLDECKPYLFPLSSMTEKQKKELEDMRWSFDNFEINNIAECIGTYREYVAHSDCFALIDWLNKNYFDYRGLIEKGLAIDATGLNTY